MKPYHRNDNKLHAHDKFQTAGFPAVGLWTMCRSWAADNWTDGFVPSYIVKRFVSERGVRVGQYAARLVEVGLWEEVEGGWQFHDWADWNTTVAERDAANAAAAERMRVSRAKRSAASSQRGRSEVAASSQPVRNEVTPEPAGQTEMFARTPEQEVRTRTRTRRETSSPAAPGTALAVQNAGTLVGEWIDSLAHRPTGDWIGQVSRKIRVYLEEGYPYDMVREAILAWAGTGKQPTQIDFHMNLILNPPTKPTWGTPRRASTTDGIFEDGLGVMARAAERDLYATQREITNEPEGVVRNPGHVGRAF